MDLDLRSMFFGTALAFLLALGIFTGGRAAADHLVSSAFEIPVR